MALHASQPDGEVQDSHVEWRHLDSDPLHQSAMSGFTYWAEHDPDAPQYRTIHSLAPADDKPLCGTTMFRLYRVKTREIDREYDLNCANCLISRLHIQNLDRAMCS